MFRGSTSSELKMFAIVSVVFWLPGGFLLAWMIGELTMAVGFVMLGTLVSVYFGSAFFELLKNGRPDYHYQQLFAIQLERLHIKRSGFLLRSGSWDLGRIASAVVDERCDQP